MSARGICEDQTGKRRRNVMNTANYSGGVQQANLPEAQAWSLANLRADIATL